MMMKTILFIGMLFLARSIDGACPIPDDPRPVIECLRYLTSVFYGLSVRNIKLVCTTSADLARCFRLETRDCVAAEVGESTLKYIETIAQDCCPNRNDRRCPISDSILNEQKCFSGDTRVTLAEGRTIPLSELRPGDRLLTYDAEMKRSISTPVLTMLDKNLNDYALFKQVTTSTGDQLKVTPSHLLLTVASGYRMAKDLEFGMNLYVRHANGSFVPSPIVELIDVMEQGYLAPLTDEGTLFVNNIAASCYATVTNHRAAHFALAPMRWWHNWFNDSSDRRGIPWYPKLLYTITMPFLR